MENNFIYSHRNKLLETHLKNVSNKSKEIVLNKKLNLDLVSKQHLAEISYLIGISHDFGKASEFFQKHLKGEDVGRESQHSLISAFFGYFLIEEYCNKYDIEYNIFKYIGAFIIRKHHGNLDSLNKCLTIKEEENENLILERQACSIKKNKEVFKIYKNLLRGFDINIREVVEKLDKSIFNKKYGRDKKEEIEDLVEEIEKKELSYELFLMIEFLFSILVDCDKKDAAGFEINNSIKTIPENSVEEYLKRERKENPEKFNPKDKKDKKLVELKNKILDSCANHENLKEENKIYSITTPTGTGKTLASFATALKLKNQLENKKNYRIHYILPFTTIIEQNYNVFKKVLSPYLGKENENDYIMKHHYLTTENIKKQNEKNKKYEFKSYMDELLFVRSWDSAVVVSSYVQLLQTIIGGKNSFMNKFHSIVNSIIILDEVQCISSRYWDVFRDLFKELAEKFNVYFIFLTATQPLIFNRVQNKGEKDCIELANPGKTFQEETLDRVNIEIDLNERDVGEFFNQFCELESFENRYLFILNTKRSSLELYNKFKKNNFKGNYKLVYLSTNLTPFDRKKKLDKILGRKKKNSDGWEIKPLEKYIIVTTQLVEAGVDISSDVCYRDFAPMDSIIQSAGRVNRFGEIKNKKGKLVLIKLKDENKPYSRYIYGKEPVLEWTEESINEEGRNFESSKDFKTIIDKFYSKAIRQDGKTKLNPEPLNSKIQNSNFSHDYKFIEDKPTHSVFILNKDSKDVFENYKEIFMRRPKTEDVWSDKMNKWRGELKKIRKRFSQFTIEIWPKKFEGMINFLKNDKKFGEEFYYLDLDDFKELKNEDKPYNSETGFNLDYEQNNFC